MTSTPVTPLEILSLAETRRRDPELALRIAEQSAQQAKKETAMTVINQLKEAASHLLVMVVMFPGLFTLADILRSAS